MSKLGKNGLQLYHNMAVAPLYDIAKEKGEITDSIPLVWEKGDYNASTHKPIKSTTIRSKMTKAESGMMLSFKDFAVPSNVNLNFFNGDVADTSTFVRVVNVLNNALMYRFTDDDAELYFSITVQDGSDTEISYGNNIRVGYPVSRKMPEVTAYGNIRGVKCGDNIFPQDICGRYDNASVYNGFLKHGVHTNASGAVYIDTVSGYFQMEEGEYRYAESIGDGNNYIDIVFYDKDFAYIGKIPNFVPSATDVAGKAKIVAPVGTKWARVGYYHDRKIMITKSYAPWKGGYRSFEEIYPVPIDYSIKPNEAFVDEIEQTVNEVLGGDMGEARFLHVTDTHHGSGDMAVDRTMLYQSMIEVAKRLSCDFILHTGDVITGNSGTPKEVWQENLAQFADLFKDCGVPVIVSRGNHDDNTVGSKSDATIIYNDWWNNHLCKAINQQSKDFVFPNNSNGYYYLDIEGKKLRIVNINSEDLTDAERLETGGQNFAKISQNQLDWLDTDALVVPDGWKIILCSHISCDSGRPNMGISNATALYNVIKTHKGAVIAYMYGHTHMSANYINEELSVQFMSVAASGGGINQTAINHTGRNKSSPSKTSQNEAPTRNMLFDVCCLSGDRIKRYRFGCKDDTFETSFDTEFGYVNA